MSSKRVLFAALALLAVGLAAPTAAAKPDLPETPEFPPWDCVQVYPWSELCEGDVGGFLRAYCDGCLVTPVGGPECVQVYPWSELCEGDVEGFIGAVAPVEVHCIAMSPFYEVCTGNVPGVVRYVSDQVAPIGPSGADCLQVYPWSRLCEALPLP